jgi:ribose-phosphate pyrophosphokinase
MRLFALDALREFGAAIAPQLDQPFTAHKERTFEGGEHKIRPLIDADGKDVLIV